jgi:hypothetical protein
MMTSISHPKSLGRYAKALFEGEAASRALAVGHKFLGAFNAADLAYPDRTSVEWAGYGDGWSNGLEGRSFFTDKDGVITRIQ